MRSFLLALVALIAAGAHAPASAEIQRHCQGSIQFEAQQVDTGNGWRSDVRGGQRIFMIGVVEGRGYCGNRSVAGRCRTRARDAIMKCAQQIWDDRWTPQPTNEKCARALDSSRPPNAAILSWRNAPAGDVKRSVEYRMCCEVEPDARSVTGTIAVVSHGGSEPKCSGRRVLSPAYVARCEELRASGLCKPRRTNPD